MRDLALKLVSRDTLDSKMMEFRLEMGRVGSVADEAQRSLKNMLETGGMGSKANQFESQLKDVKDTLQRLRQEVNSPGSHCLSNASRYLDANPDA